MLQPHGSGAQSLENQRVHPVKHLVLQGNRIHVRQKILPPFRGKTASLPRQQCPRVLPLFKYQAVILKSLSGPDGAAERRMSADAKRHILPARVLYVKARFKAVFRQGMAYGKYERERVLFQGLRVLPEAKLHEILPLGSYGKFLPPGKAMAGHTTDFLSNLYRPVPQGAHNGKEHRIPAGPIGRVPVPDILVRSVPQRHQLAAHGIRPGLQAAFSQRDLHTPPPSPGHARAVFSIIVREKEKRNTPPGGLSARRHIARPPRSHHPRLPPSPWSP